MKTITPQQLLTLRNIVAETRQTIDGDSPLYVVTLHESDMDTHHLEVHVWHTRTQQEEQAMHAAVFGLRDRIRNAGIPCDLQLADKGIYQDTYHVNPELLAR